jgi:hypothetical protein
MKMNMSSLINEKEIFEFKSRFEKGELVWICQNESERQTQVLICDVEKKDGSKVRYSFLDNRGQLRWFEEFFDIFTGESKTSYSSWNRYSPIKYSVKKV